MKVYIPKEISEELAEETGWHIGDGSMNYYDNKGFKWGLDQLRGHIEDDKEHYIKRIKPIFKFFYDINISLREMPSTRVFGFQIWSNDLIKFKEDLGLKPGPKIDVKIPKIFLENKNLKIAVVRGIFDTDGGIYLEKKNNKFYPRTYITTISEILSRQLLEILNEMGLRATLHSYIPKERNKKKTYVITLRGVLMFYKFMELINPANPKHIQKYKSFKEKFLKNFQ